MKTLLKYSIRDFTPYIFNTAYRRFCQTKDTGLSRLSAYWWKLRLGKKVQFFGRPIFWRHPTATITIGDHCIFRSSEWSNSIGLNRRCFISACKGAEIKIGTSSGFSGAVIAATSSISIGNRVLLGGNCTILDTDRHPIDPLARMNREKVISRPVVIEDDVFLGMNVVVLKGCKIGRGSVVAANSVVSSSLPPGVIAGGIPAKVR